MKKSYFSLIALFLLSTFLSCSRSVTRVNSSETIDLSGKWNDTDSQQAAHELTNQVLSESWLSNFKSANNNEEPVVIVGLVANKTSEHIDAETFIRDIERAFINSGDVKLVQGGQKRDEIRGERSDQQKYSTSESLKAWGKEVGADYMMQGDISSITDQEGRQKVVFYQIDLQLTDIESNEIVWLGDKKIKKLVKN